MDRAWKVVCDDSRELGHYVNSENAKYTFEVTGSREICGFCDLANTCKILAWNEEMRGFWLTCGSYCDYSSNLPLAGIDHRSFRDFNVCKNGVGWLVLSK